MRCPSFRRDEHNVSGSGERLAGDADTPPGVHGLEPRPGATTTPTSSRARTIRTATRGICPGNDTRIEPPAEVSWYGSLLDGKADASGLQYVRNRYYDPATGRFTQRDPIGLKGGLNQYGYAAGDPVNNSDPSGFIVCFGSAQRSRLVRETERATGSKIEVDDFGCIKSIAVTDSNSVRAEFLRRRLTQLHEDGQTYYVGVSGAESAYYPWARRVGLDLSLRGGYFSRDRNGNCFSTTTDYADNDFASIIAHELLGHAWGMRFDPARHNAGRTASEQLRSGQAMAVAAENIAHAYLGEPLRCKY